MRNTVLILLFSALQVFATGSYAQTKKISLAMDNATIRDVLYAIQNQSEFYFLYNSELINVDPKIDITIEEEKIDEILTRLFDKNEVDFLIKDRYIVLTPVGGNAELFDQRTISGTVTDESGQPLPGVTVVVKGTTKGTVTNADGNYSLTNVPEDATLVFSFVGMRTQEVTIENQSTINVTLESETIGVDEVVVIGYTSTSRKNVASSISQINSEQIAGLSTSDVRQTMQGKIAGVQVLNDNGDPGSGARIIIRGMGSFSNPDPLYVIDGIQGGDINSVPTQNIESITVLKDASTTAIYGSAAANGVVVITTKSGVRGDVRVDYEGSVGVGQVNSRYDMLNASQYVDLVGDIQAAKGLPLTDKLESDYVRVDRTDWQDAMFRNALITDHNIRLSGGGENVTYSFSTGYQNHESTVIDRNFERVTVGAKLNERLFSNKVRLGQNLRVRNDFIKGHLASLSSGLMLPPYMPIYDPDNLGGYARVLRTEDLSDINNPYNDIYNSDLERRTLSVNFEFNGEVDLYDGLMFKSQGRLSAGNYHQYDWDYPSKGGQLDRTTAGISETYNFLYSFILENFFSYNKTFGEHLISATAGNSYNPSRIFREVSVSGSDYTSDAIKNVSLANTTSLNNAKVNSGKSRISYFGSLGYTFKERYVLNASIRRDASSVFGANNRWGTFYGIGAAWSLSQEDFMKSIAAITNLKLRTSYGKTGNDNIPAFLTSASVWKGSSNNIVYSFGDGTDFTTGSTINSIPNPDLKWEETTQFDIGADIGFLNNRLNFILDYYNRKNEDLLIETQLPLSTGLGNPSGNATQWVNAASMKNSGFEFAVNYADNSKRFKWDIGLNATYSTNEVTALGTIGDIPITKGQFNNAVGNSTRTDIGHPLAAYYGYVIDHVVVDQAEVDMLNEAAELASGGEVTEYKAGLQPGDFIWKDIDGNGYLDTDDRTFIGDPSPAWQYGGVFNATFSNFDFQLQFHGLADVDVINGTRYDIESMVRPYNSTTKTLERWKQEGDVATMPAAGQNTGANFLFSNFYVEKGDYLRVKNIVLGYTLPSSIFNKVFNKFRIYVAIQNALTLTNYSGYDPEISTYDADNNNLLIFSRGVDRNQRPNPTVYRFGVQLNF